MATASIKLFKMTHNLSRRSTWISNWMRPENLRAILLLTSITILGIGLALRFAPFYLDDSFIAFRYAWNLASGKGFVFNPGGQEVEGFTSPAWVFLLTVVGASFGKGFIAYGATALGLLSLSVCLVLAFVISRSILQSEGIKSSWLLAATSPLILAVFPPISFYSVSGLEPLLFLAVLIVFVGAANGIINIYWGLIAGALAIWIRPEGAWFPIALGAQYLGQATWDRKSIKRGVALVCSVVCGCILIGFWRLAVFNEVLPNTYWAKEPSFSSGLNYLWSVLKTPWGASAAVFGLLGALTGNKSHRGFFTAAVAWLAAAVAEGGDFMPLGRFCLPAMTMFIFSGAGITTTHLRLVKSEKSIISAKHSLVYAVVVVALFCSVLVWQNNRTTQNSHKTDATFYEDQRAISVWIKNSGARSVALVDIGMVGFKTDIEIIDLAGLTDKVIGRSQGGHLEKLFPIDYIFVERRPELIVMRINAPPKITKRGVLSISPFYGFSQVEKMIWSDKRFNEFYRFIAAFLPAVEDDKYYGKLLFSRKEVSLDKRNLPKNPIIRLAPKL